MMPCLSTTNCQYLGRPCDMKDVMSQLIFTLENGQIKPLYLKPTRRAYEDMSHAITLEAGVINTDAKDLEDRVKQGHAALIYAGGQIIAYVSFIEIYSRQVRGQLAAHLSIPVSRLPDFKVMETATGWSHPDYRNSGYSTVLRCILYQRFSSQDTLFVGTCYGKGAGSLLAKDGWALIPWSGFPYVTALCGWFRQKPDGTIEEMLMRTGKWRAMKHPPYEGDILSGDDALAHRACETHYHIWANSVSLAAAAENQLRFLDLEGWHQALTVIAEG